MKSDKEIRSLTGLRGVAACYVLLLHYFSGLPYKNPLNILIAHGYLSVDLFFVLSGFVMTLNYARLFEQGLSWRPYRTFLCRRIARVYPLYFFGTIAATALILLGWLGSRPPVGRLAALLFENLAMVQTWGLGPSLDPPGWSISAEWAAYLIFPVLLALVYFKRSSAWRWGAAVVGIGVLGCLCILPPNIIQRSEPRALLFIWHFNYGLAVWRCLPEFTFGVLAAHRYVYRAKTAAPPSNWLVWGTSIALMSLLCMPATDLAVVLMFPVLILFVIPENAVSRILGSAPIHYLGVLSYSIYIVHDILSGLLSEVHASAARHGLRHAQTYAAFVGVVVTAFISPLAYRFIEKPGRIYLRRLLEGTPSTPSSYPTSFDPRAIPAMEPTSNNQN